MNSQILLINDTLTFWDLSNKVCVYMYCIGIVTIILMHSKGSNCHLTLSTLMSIVKHIRHLKVGSGFVLISSQIVIYDKKFDILSWKNEMCIFSLSSAANIWQGIFILSVYARAPNELFYKIAVLQWVFCWEN